MAQTGTGLSRTPKATGSKAGVAAMVLVGMIKVSSDSRPKKLDGGRGAGGRECDETGQ
jgi:hypothetical protein